MAKPAKNSAPLLLGAAYYPEHDPEREWQQDARLMRDLGFTCIRIGEFCWNCMQQSDGTLTLDWLERCVELFAAHGIRTVLCTPTATPPVWLTERYPDLPCVTADGRQGLFGGRRHYSLFHAGYRENCRRIAEALAQRFGAHPAVAGWQLDNEVGSYYTVDCSPPAVAAYHAWLQRRYGTVAALNQAWGLIFWNQEVARFDQVPAPTEMMCTRNPSAILDYNRFCLEGMAEFLLAQAAVVRPLADPAQFVTACAVETVLHTLYRLQRERGVDWVDAVTLHNYPELQPEPGQVAMQLDRFRSLHPPGRYHALEHQLGSGYTTTGGFNPAVRRYWSLETLAHGAQSLLWFHWRRFRTGCEWRHSSIVERDRRPRSVYRDVQHIVRDMRRLEPLLAGARVREDVQVLLSLDNALAHDRASEAQFWMAIQLPDATRHRFPMWEQVVRRALYLPLTRQGLTLGFVSEADGWDPARPLLLPELDICSAALVAKLTAFCRRGGTVVCLPGAGERDEFGAQREAPPPGLLAPLFGVEHAEYYPLEPDQGAAFDHMQGCEQTLAGARPDRPVATVRVGRCDVPCDVRHGEVLALQGARALGVYQSGRFAGQPAMAARRVGRGRAVYLGALPVDADAALQLWPLLLPKLARQPLPFTRVSWESARGAFAFLLNGSPVACRLPVPVPDLLSGRRLSQLPAWGVAVVEA